MVSDTEDRAGALLEGAVHSHFSPHSLQPDFSACGIELHCSGQVGLQTFGTGSPWEGGKAAQAGLPAAMASTPGGQPLQEGEYTFS